MALIQVALNGKTLETELSVTNTGSSDFEFQAALHSYFRCSDINKVWLVVQYLAVFYRYSSLLCSLLRDYRQLMIILLQNSLVFHRADSCWAAPHPTCTNVPFSHRKTERMASVVAQ